MKNRPAESRYECGSLGGAGQSNLDRAKWADHLAKMVLEIAAGRVLLSDAPKCDQRWLDILIGGSGPKIDNFDSFFGCRSLKRTEQSLPETCIAPTMIGISDDDPSRER